jgi:hypothetical protein
MADKQIVPFGMDLYKPPLVNDSQAIIPVLEPTPLVVIPPKPRQWSYKQSYFTQVRQPTLPPLSKCLFLKDALLKGPIVRLPQDIKLLPPKANETLIGVKLNKLGQVICAKYTTGTPCPTIDGVRAHQSKIKFILPKETLKGPTPPLDRQGKHPRVTIAMLDMRTEHMGQMISALKKHNTLLMKNVDALGAKLETKIKERKRLTRQVEFLCKCIRKE